MLIKLCALVLAITGLLAWMWPLILLAVLVIVAQAVALGDWSTAAACVLAAPLIGAAYAGLGWSLLVLGLGGLGWAVWPLVRR